MKLTDTILDLIKLEATYEIAGNGSIAIDQVPKPNTSISPSTKVYLYAKSDEGIKTVVIPDVVGKTSQEANHTLYSSKLSQQYI